MEKINLELDTIDTDYLNKLYQQEKQLRLANNKTKCLEINIKILSIFIEAKDLNGYLATLKNILKKKEQSGFVIYHLVRYSADSFMKLIKEDKILFLKYLECVKFVLDNLKKINDKDNCFEEMKTNLIDLLDKNKLDEFKDLLSKNKFDPEELINEKKQLKRISISDFSEFNNSNSSTKIDKLEISLNKDYTSSTRNFNLISPNKKVVSNTDTLGINQDIKKDQIKYEVINQVKLPYIRIGVVITLSSLEIKRIFIEEMRKHKVIIKGDENSDTVQADKKCFNIFKSILDCLKIKSNNSNLNTIQFSIKYSENFHERIIEIKSLSGKREICEEMILSFIHVIAKKLVKVRKIKVEAINIDKILRENREEEKRRLSTIYGMGSIMNYESLKEEDNSIVDFSNKEAMNFYELYKILSQENYELGKSVSDFIKNFKEENLKIEEASKNIPKQMESISKFIDSCVSAFFCYFNYGKSITEKMLPYVRPTVENLIFKKLSDNLTQLYTYKYHEENKKFKESQQRIVKNLSCNQIMEFLEIKKKFRNSDKTSIPFKMTIDYINKIEFEHTPKDKFETLMRANLELRNEVLDVTNGKFELNSMDDELPLFIYIMSQINLKNALVELNLIENYLLFSPNLDKESKVLTNFRSSIFYITHEWKVDDKNKEK